MLLVMSLLMGCGAAADPQAQTGNAADARSATAGTVTETQGQGTSSGAVTDTTVTDTADTPVSEAVPQATAEPLPAARMTAEQVPVYYSGNYGSEDEELTMYFLDGNTQIAYYDMDTVCHVMEMIYHGGYGDYEKDPGYSLSYEIKDGKVVFTRENGHTMSLDFDADTITFDDFDMFICHSFDRAAIELAHADGFDDEGNPEYLKHNEDMTYTRYGKEYTFDLHKYGIDLVSENGSFYLQAQTMADVLVLTTYTSYVYTGSAAVYVNYNTFQDDYAELTGTAAVIYDTKPDNRSQALIDYTYNELCMLIDCEYGLKDSHGISDADTFMQEHHYYGKSLKELICSRDPAEMEAGMYNLAYSVIDDLHSAYLAPGPYLTQDRYKDIPELSAGPCYYSIFSDYSRFLNIRSEYLGTPLPYQEIGNTAYVTFDSFESWERDYYSDPPTDPADLDLVGLIIYAHSMITRENSPIENVVIDLSVNSGGMEDALAFLCAWVLGDASFDMFNPYTEAISSCSYSCDANLDRKFDSADCITGKNVYCLVSPISFSCGNSAAVVFKASHRVTLLGQHTGGGTCIVLPFSTASGSQLQTSGFRVMGMRQNGAVYNVDRGVEPDIYLSKVESFYDREALTEYINNMK